MLIVAAFILGVCINQASAQDVSVQVGPGVGVQVQSGYVVPGQVYVVPRPYYYHVKPLFRTPWRDRIWHNRHYRYHRLGRLLGPTVVIQNQ